MPRHDSQAPWLRPVRYYPHLLDIGPGPRVECGTLTHLKRVLPGTQYGLPRSKNSKKFKSTCRFIQKWRPVAQDGAGEIMLYKLDVPYHSPLLPRISLLTTTTYPV